MTQVRKHYTLDAHESQAIWFTGCLVTIPASGEQMLPIIYNRSPN